MPRDKLHGNTIFVLEPRWQEKLSKLPEHGMAYQYVDVTLKSGAIMEGLIVLSCAFFQEQVWFDDDDIQDVTLSQRFSRQNPPPRFSAQNPPR